MSRKIFVDCEYNDHAVLVFCFLTDTGERVAIDTRTPEGRQELAAFVASNLDALWLSYSVMAEMGALLRCGVSLSGMRWFDLMIEGAMITGTFEEFYVPRASLLKHLTIFEIPHETPEFKRDMIELILSKADFTDEEFADITAYCWTDVIPLPVLHSRIEGFHEVHPASMWEESHATYRAEYAKASAILADRSKGLPVNEDWLERIFKNRTAIRMTLAQKANEEYGPIYAFNHKTGDYSFSYLGLQAYLETQPWGLEWERTPSGRLRTDRTYVDDLVKKFPNARLLRWVQDGLAQLKSDGLMKLVEHDDKGEAYVRPVSIPFYTVTGRNQPLVSRGFILNMPPWLRHVIRPHKGRVLIAADWGKQEIAIGCALSGDEALLKAYLTGDIYLTLGKMAGAIPPDGTKDSHPTQRQTYKAVQLGLGYGMGKPSLARQIYNDINAGSDVVVHDMEWCEEQANTISDWHKATFKTYWTFLDQEARAAKKEGWNSSLDGWMYFANGNTKHTRLINFPSQSNGAAMLREAIRDLAFKSDLNVVCSLHDAIYIECAEEDADAHKTRLKLAMDQAAASIVGDIPIDVDFKTFTHETGFYDGRGTATLKMIKDIIEEIEINGPPATPEKPPKGMKRLRAALMGEEFFQ
jgi:hypothetical protein